MRVIQSEHFADWYEGLRDRKAKAIVFIRLLRLEGGNFGDVKYFDGIGEMRISYGPGYRIYFVRRGADVVILLGGGDKASQRRDIEKAKRLASEI